MHWPAPMTKEGKADKSINWIDTWKGMEKVYKEHSDKVKAIGVSNVSIEFFEKLLKEATVIPAVNQIELHPYVNLGCFNRIFVYAHYLSEVAYKRTLLSIVSTRVSL